MDICTLKTLKHLDLSDNLLSSLPRQISQLIDLKTLDLSQNKFEILPTFLGKLWQIKTLKLQGNDIQDPEIAKLITDDGRHGLEIIRYLLNKYDVWIPRLPDRMFIDYALDQDDSKFKFSVLSYNILADSFCRPRMYAYCPEWARKWSHRRQVILDQLNKYRTDIIALQEVEVEAFDKILVPELSKLGYEGTIQYRDDLLYEGGICVNGSATFFKKSKFELVKNYPINAKEVFGKPYDENDERYKRVQLNTSVDQATLLKIKVCDGKKMILFLSGHMFSKAGDDDIRLIQSSIMLHSLHKIRDECLAEFKLPEGSISTIICGDMNSSPLIPHIKFIRTGRITEEALKYYSYDYSEFLSKILRTTKECRNDGESVTIFHSDLPLESSYNVDPGTETMKFTSETYHLTAILDYIFFDDSLLKLRSVLGDINHNWLKENQQCGFPCPGIPSDHLPILSVFEWR